MQVVSRKEALEKGLERYFTGKVCKRGHISERVTKGSHCLGCIEVYNISRRKENPKRIKGVRQDNYIRLKTWSDNNRDKKNATLAAWKKRNPGKVNADAVARALAKKQRTPLWANLVEIKRIYIECASISRKSGIKHHVDHIYPLHGETVCGLHVENNLRIITAEENMKKHNKLIESIE